MKKGFAIATGAVAVVAVVVALVVVISDEEPTTRRVESATRGQAETSEATTDLTTSTVSSATTLVGPTATSTSTPSAGKEGLVAPAGDELTIRFDGVGPVALGQVESGFSTNWDIADAAVGDCASRDAAGGWWLGSLTGDPSDPTKARLFEIQVEDSRYRTASGVGVGTSLEALRRVYGDQLVVDEMDGWEHPTNGLLAMYTKVAGVREGNQALTFVLDEDERVRQVEVSYVDGWGDDEGCA